MPDIPQGFRPLDPGRINPMDPVEMAYWCRSFGCTLDQMNDAIARVGEHVEEVRGELRRSNPASA